MNTPAETSTPVLENPDPAMGDPAPADIALDAIDESHDELLGFVAQLAGLLGTPRVVQLEWIQPCCLQLSRFEADSGAPEIQEYHAGGTALRLPLTDDGTETLFNLGSLASLDDASLGRWLGELYRVSGGNVWLSLPVTASRSRAWWESRCFAAGFRKHPRLLEVLPYATLEDDGDTLVLLLQKIPDAGLARYPLAALRAARDLHLDMTRETGRRSDAHLARYQLARRYLPESGWVLDVSCGLGGGAALLADACRAVRVMGLEASNFAVAYSRSCYQPGQDNLDYQVGQPCDLSRFADASIDLVVAFELLECLREPEAFLAEARRVLKRGGRLVCSVPNLWVDEHGQDPNPQHHQVFTFAKLAKLCREFLTPEHAFLQTAGGGLKLPRATRQLCQVPLPPTGLQDKAEWWLLTAVKY